jgi:hypothetical protein
MVTMEGPWFNAEGLNMVQFHIHHPRKKKDFKYQNQEIKAKKKEENLVHVVLKCTWPGLLLPSTNKRLDTCVVDYIYKAEELRFQVLKYQNVKPFIVENCTPFRVYIYAFEWIKTICLHCMRFEDVEDIIYSFLFKFDQRVCSTNSKTRVHTK